MNVLQYYNIIMKVSFNDNVVDDDDSESYERYDTLVLLLWNLYYIFITYYLFYTMKEVYITTVNEY